MKHVLLFSQAIHYQTMHLNEVGAAMHHSIFSNNRSQRNLEERILPGGGNSSTALSEFKSIRCVGDITECNL